MKVTPLDIRRKEFKRSMRGYADEEVDIFLDEVADEFERLYQENAEMHDRLQRLEEQIAGHAQIKDALEKTLISAQLQSDEMKLNARKEGELILQEAELKARQIVNESYSETQRVQQTLVQLKHLEEDFRFKFRSLLEGHLKLLNDAAIVAPSAQASAVEGSKSSVEKLPLVVPSPTEVAVVDEIPTEETDTVLSESDAGETVPLMGAVAAVSQVIGVTDAGSTAEVVSAAGVAGTVGLADDSAKSFIEESTAEALRGTTGTITDAPKDEPEARGFFFGRQLEDIDDTFPSQEISGKDKSRDFEW